MGSYYELAVGAFVVESGKNYVFSDVFAPFQLGDLDRTTGRTDDIDPYVFRTTARIAVRRLELLGYTSSSARTEFLEGYATLDDWYRGYVPADLAAPSGFETWCALLRDVLAATKRGQSLNADDVEDERLQYILGAGQIDGSRIYPDAHHLGFVSGGSLVVLRALLDLVPGDEIVSLDLTDLVGGGWVKPEELRDHVGKEPIIVLTEGKSDSRLLRASFELLAPEFVSYISFIDFESVNAKGGTDELVQFVRMFVGCGIRNRIVVLFDNDTAGHDAMKRLLETKLPTNVYAMTLPPLDAARAYPTLGPEGQSIADVNERACSLELYLGRDVLLGDDGSPLPVRWTGFVERLGRYQGQIAKKGEVQKRYEEKLAKAKADPGLRGALDFSGVVAIIDAIFSAVAGR